MRFLTNYLDIDDRSYTVIGQTNTVYCCTFSHVSIPYASEVVLKNYCLILYGCEMWNLENPAIDGLRVTLYYERPRVLVRRNWRLPYNCHCYIADTEWPPYDVITLRAS